MTNNVMSRRWRGLLDDPIDPATVHFTAQPAGKIDCDGCLFAGQTAAVCNQVGALAVRRALPDCSPRSGPGFIYVLDDSDPRQVRIEEILQGDEND